MLRKAKNLLGRLRARWEASHISYKKLVKYAALAGGILAIICHWVPKDYRQLCDAVAALCGGG